LQIECHIPLMPTDGADFRTNKICFGKAYAFARDGADAAVVAGCLVSGVERYIKFCGGAPAFVAVADAVLAVCCAGFGGARLFRELDEVGAKFAHSPMTRDIVSAAERIGLETLAQGGRVSRQEVAESILGHIGERQCDAILPYVVRRRTGSLAAGSEDVASYKSCLKQVPEMADLAARMLNSSPKGLPARAAKVTPVSHSADGLNEEL
jgi:hypothetical protein